MTNFRILASLIFCVGCLTIAAFSQDTHYNYPFTVECPGGLVKASESIKITVKFPNVEDAKMEATWNWTISAGTIVSGQGTPEITVDARHARESIDATVHRSLGGRDWIGAQKSDSCTAILAIEPEPRLVDEFRTAGSNCEDGFARTDSFFHQLQSDPVAQGMIIFYGDAKDARASRRRQLQLSNHIKFRNFDPTRITMIRGGRKVEGTTQFWIIPPGADAPTPDAGTLPPEADDPKPIKPYVYASEHPDGIPGCNDNIYEVEEYAKELLADPKNSGQIVIGESSRTKFNRKSRELLSLLADHGVARNKIKLAYKYVRPNRLLEFTELWIIPPAIAKPVPTRLHGHFF